MEAPLMARGMTSPTRPSSRCTARCCTANATTDAWPPAISARRRRRRDAEGWAADMTRTWPVLGKVSRPRSATPTSWCWPRRSGDRRGDAGRALSRRAHPAPSGAGRGPRRPGHLARQSIELAATASVRCSSRTASGTSSASTCTTWKTSAIAPASAPGASAPSGSGCCALRLDRDLAPGMAVTIEPGFYSLARDPRRSRAEQVAGDRLDRDGWPPSPTCAASASRTTCS